MLDFAGVFFDVIVLVLVAGVGSLVFKLIRSKVLLSFWRSETIYWEFSGIWVVSGWFFFWSLQSLLVLSRLCGMRCKAPSSPLQRRAKGHSTPLVVCVADRQLLTLGCVT